MKLFITAKLFPEYIDQLRKNFDVIYKDNDSPLSEEQLIQYSHDAHIILCQLYDPISSKVIEGARHLKMIANCAVGYNNIDLEAARKKNILVTNTPDVLTDATADLTWALILGIARRLKEGIHMMEQGSFSGWNLHLLTGSDIVGKTLGVIGAGKIGSAVIKRAMAWNMKIIYYNRNSNPSIEKKYNAVKKSLDSLLGESDFVSLHCPLTPETMHLITINELKKMKPTAFLINTARGPVVKESDLQLALTEKMIAGAAADVFEFEPKVSDNLLKLNNFLATPHIGSATYSTRRRMVELCVSAIETYMIQNKIPENSVLNPV